ncbi:MAG: hypothetical protein ABEH77_07125 [Halobacteriaceae archaeon]
MEYGLVTRSEDVLDWGFEPTFYEVESVAGRVADPEPGTVCAVACFADTAAVEATPELAPVDADGERATREGRRFDWSPVCPSVESYREGLLETIADAAAVTGDVRLDEVGFPAAGYCHCERCDGAFAASDYDERADWRAATVESFVGAARDRVPGTLYLTLFPDPYPGHLRAQRGVDPAALTEYVDEFVVPLYDSAYATTYWLESLASGFRDELAAPFGVELYAVEPDLEDLIHATEVAEAYADSVSFGYDAANARAAVRRMRAEANEGETHRPE